MLGYLSLGIICSSKLTVFLELRFRKTVCFSEKIMSGDKYPSIFFAPNGGYCLYNYLPWLIARFGSNKYHPGGPTLYICSFPLLLIWIKIPFYPRFWLWSMILSVWFLILSRDLLSPDFKNFDAMERHLGSTLYSGLVKGVSARNGDLNDDL